MGQFIAIEGIDGVGKSTTIEQLKKIMPDAVFTREPGGTNFAELLRSLMLNDIKDVTEISWVYLICAARYDHLIKVIIPALNEGKTVICDRYVLSTLMYQCSENLQAYELLKRCMKLEQTWFGKDVQLSRSIILDSDDELILERKKSAQNINRYDSLTKEELSRRRNQLAAAKEMYSRILPDSGITTVKIDKDDSPEMVAKKIKQIITIFEE